MDSEQVTMAVASGERADRERLRMLMDGSADVVIVAECPDTPCVHGMMGSVRPDILFIDVGMLDAASGAGTAPGGLPLLIHMSADASHALRSFEAGAFDYLVRPIEHARLAVSVARAVEQVRRVRDGALIDAVAREQRALGRRQRERRRLAPSSPVVLDVGSRVLFLDAGELVWVRECDGVLEACCRGGIHTVQSTFEQVVRRLDPERFIRIQPALVVNVETIRDLRISPHYDGTIRLRDGSMLPLTSSGFAALTDQLGR